MPVADTLSQKSMQYHNDSLMEGMETQVHTLISNVPVSDSKLQEIREATAQDAQFLALKRAAKAG